MESGRLRRPAAVAEHCRWLTPALIDWGEFAMALILGLAAALFWGTGDYLVRIVEARIGVRRALLRGHLVTLLFVPLAWPLVDAPSFAAVRPVVWALALLAALANLGMIAALYRGL